MKKLFLYLSKHYLKNFILITFALVFTSVLIDFLQHIHSIEGFNRKILYFYYRFQEYLSYIFPLTLVFGAIATFYSLVTKSYLIVIESLSYSKKEIIKPFIILSLIIYAFFICLNFTKFSYANSSANALTYSKDDIEGLKNLFFKYNDSFVYANKLDIVHKKFDDITLYKIKYGKLDEILHFKEAKFHKNRWIAKNIELKKLLYKKNTPMGYITKHLDKIEILKDYYPKVIKLLYEGKRMSISDGIRAYLLSKEQNINTNKILAALISKFFMPLYAPLLIIIIFFNTPVSKRAFNKGKYLFFSIGSALIIWTILYSLNMLSLSGTINPWLGQPLIILALFIGTVYNYIKAK